MIASIIAFYNKLKIYHVEAGLRTNNIHDPFPEELNRKIISLIASTNFCPTIANKKNLYDEGITKNIYITGNTVIDSLYLIERKIKSSVFYKKKIITKLEKLIFKKFYAEKYILITGHRRENFGNGFVNIFDTLDKVAKNNKDVNFIFPVHLNPNVRNIALSTLKGNNNFFLIPPLSYELMIFLMMNAIFIVTDSGGIQEEGPALGKFIIVTRKNTERPEALETKHVKLVGTNKHILETQLNKAINNFEELKKLPRSRIYGNGKASKKIISFVVKENVF
jgi:UDP-N-acetylglucosamine 2-epimerase (non-hydrolysing)